MQATNLIEETKFITLPVECPSDLDAYFKLNTNISIDKIKASLESVKNSISESQNLIQEIQESIEEYRTEYMKKHGNSVKNKDYLNYANNIENRVKHLISLLNSFKGFIRTKLEETLSNVILNNLIPAMENFNNENCPPFSNIKIKAIYENNNIENKIIYSPDLNQIIDILNDAFENSVHKILNNSVLNSISQLLVPFGQNNSNLSLNSLCIFFIKILLKS